MKTQPASSATRSDYPFTLHPVTQHQSVRALWQARVTATPDHVAYVFFDKRGARTEITFARAWTHIQTLARVWTKKSADIAPDRPIILCDHLSYPWVVTFWTLACLGRPVIILNPARPARQLALLARQAKAGLWIGTDVPTDRGGRPILPSLRLTDGADNNDIQTWLQQASHSQHQKPYAWPEVNLDQDLVILTTSGTTAAPKLVPLTHRQMLADAAGATSLVTVSGDTLLSLIPPDHAFGLACDLLISLHDDATLAWPRPSDDLAFVFSRIRPTHLFLAPVIAKTFIDQVQVTSTDGSIDLGQTAARLWHFLGGHVRQVIIGGTQVPELIVKVFTQAGITTLIGYGITECGPIIATNTPQANNPLSVGWTLPNIEVKINNPDPQGRGEILVSGPTITRGYLGMPRASQKVLRQGWFHTGDIGFFDQKGALHVIGRRDNAIIKQNGEVVYPEVIETLLQADPSIAQALVDIQFTPDHDRLVAHVCLHHDQDDTDAYLDRLCTRVNRQLPRSYQLTCIINAGPLACTPSGKIVRRQHDKRVRQPKTSG